MSATLSLSLELIRVDRADDPYAFHFASQDYLMRSEGGSYQRSRLDWDQSLLVELQAVSRPGCAATTLQRMGERLRQFLTPLGWVEHERTLLQAIRENRHVLLTVRLAAAELYALPWELLTIRATGQHVGELPGVLLRYEWPETKTIPESPRPRLGCGRILLAWSAAGGSVPAAEHQAAIVTACNAGFVPFDPVKDVLPNASLGQLTTVLDTAKRVGTPIAVLHLLCHGGPVAGTFGLVLHGEDTGDCVTVDAAQLRRVLAPYADMIRLIVLMACDSGNPGVIGNQLGSVAQTLHRAGIASVIASRYPLSVVGSITLAQSLYQRLLVAPDSLEVALLLARSHLGVDTENRDWVSVQLYARASDGTDTRPVVFRPYQGLAAFGQQQQRFFFGREVLSGKVWTHLRDLFEKPAATRLLTLLGPSGSGKSSVARAGLMSELARRPIAGLGLQRVVIFKPGEHPLTALEDGLSTLPREPVDAPVLVLVDQFEEIYTQCLVARERDAFVERVLSAARNQDRRISVVLTLRSDFLGDTLRQHPQLNRLIGEQAVIVSAMSQQEQQRAIAQPAAQSGRRIDDATVDLLLSQALGSASALPLLEFTLSRIWEGMLAGNEAGNVLRAIGGVGGSLARQAQHIYDSLTTAEQATARRALVRLVQLGEGTPNTRRRQRVRELCGGEDTPAMVLAVLRRFADENTRLVTMSGSGDEAIAEVTHEALFDHWADLRQWINEGRADRRFHDRAAEAARLWAEADQPVGRLWRPPDLDLLRDYQQRCPEEMNLQQRAFLSAAERRQQREKLAGLGSLCAIVTATFVASGTYIVKERQRIQTERQQAIKVAESRERIRQQLLKSYVEKGRLLLLEKDQPLEALLWLHRAQQENSEDPILPDLLRTALSFVDATNSILSGHRDRVISALYSPDGRRVVTASADRTARVWDSESGQLVVELKGHVDSVYRLAYSPNSRRVVTASADRTARIWDAESGRLVVILKDHTDRITSVGFSPDGRRVVTASADRTARVWDVDSGRLLAVLNGHSDGVMMVAYSPDGRRIVTASQDKTARIWDAESGHLVSVLKGHSDNVSGVAYSGDGRRIVTVCEGKTARVWDSNTGRMVAELVGHTGRLWSAAYSRDGRRIVTASEDGTARIWDADAGTQLTTLTGHRSRILSAVYSPDDSRVVTASADRTARIWDAQSGRALAVLTGHVASVTGAVYSPDGHRIVTASADKTARIWDAEAGRGSVAFSGHSDSVTSASYSLDGRRVVSASMDKTARIWDADTGHLLAVLAGHTDRVFGAVYDPSRRHIVTASADRTARIWDADTGHLLAVLAGHKDVVFSAIYSPNGRGIVTASADRTARIWDADFGRLLVELKGHTDSVTSASFFPDGHRILTTSEDKTARVWDTASGLLLTELKGHDDSVRSAAYSPDGRRIVTASADGTARTWDAGTGGLLVVFKGHGDSVSGATYSPDGHRIITVSTDGAARVWDADSGRLLAELKGHGDSISSAAYRPDGRRIVTAGADGTAQVWEADSGRLLAQIKGNDNNITSVMYSPDGRRVLTTSADTFARVWDFAPETRSPGEIARLLGCFVPIAFERQDSDVIISTQPTPADCQYRVRVR